jgi:hypothetical protein
MTSVGFEVAVAEPFAFDAVTCERMRNPASAWRTTYVARWACPMTLQSEASGRPLP